MLASTYLCIMQSAMEWERDKLRKRENERETQEAERDRKRERMEGDGSMILCIMRVEHERD